MAQTGHRSFIGLLEYKQVEKRKKKTLWKKEISRFWNIYLLTCLTAREIEDALHCPRNLIQRARSIGLQNLLTRSLMPVHRLSSLNVYSMDQKGIRVDLTYLQTLCSMNS